MRRHRKHVAAIARKRLEYQALARAPAYFHFLKTRPKSAPLRRQWLPPLCARAPPPPPEYDHGIPYPAPETDAPGTARFRCPRPQPQRVVHTSGSIHPTHRSPIAVRLQHPRLRPTANPAEHEIRRREQFAPARFLERRLCRAGKRLPSFAGTAVTAILRQRL